jgi:hypothetical protein
MSPRVTALAVAASMITSAHGGSLQVQANDEYMNVRTGPGTNCARSAS